MLLLLLCLLLSCWAPSCPNPVPLEEDCPKSALLDEAIEYFRSLQGKNETVPPKKVTLTTDQEKGNAVRYLGKFIEALKSDGEKSTDNSGVIKNLGAIYAARTKCTGWLECTWDPHQNAGFFKNFIELLQFLKTFNSLRIEHNC